MSAHYPTPPPKKWSWARLPKAHAVRYGLIAGGVWFGLAGAAGCADDPPLPAAGSGRSGTTLEPVDTCATPNQGCPCETDAAVVDCGQVLEKHQEYVTCSVGHRSCDAGKWGACIGERTTQSKVPVAAPGAHYRILALGAGAECPENFDPCDPFCHQFVDEPGDFPTDPGFSNTDDGLTLTESVANGCNSLELSATATTLHVNRFSPITLQEGAIALNAKLLPNGCRASPFLTAWTLDKFDAGQVSGTNNQNGVFSVTTPIAGDVVVTAYAAGLSGSLTLHVKVNVLDAPSSNGAANPNLAATGAQVTTFGTLLAPLPGSAATTATWLYPYANTFFPLGLLPPAVLYRYAAAGAGAVKVSLRYPTSQTATGSDFNYSLIVKEANGISQAAGLAANTLDPQVVVPTLAWAAFEQTARGADAELLVQRLPAAGTLEQETRQTVHFVNGQLKGTVYYNSYSSPQGGNTGAVLSIAPGASSPELAVQPSGKCTVCHSINVSGTQLIANGGRTSNSYSYNQSRRYDLTNGAAPSPNVLSSYDAPAADAANVPGDRFTFGAPLTDGAYYMTHGGTSAGDPNFRAPPDFSNLFNVGAPSTIVPVAGWPANALAVTPRFSVDGKRLAFGFWGGSALNQTPSGTLTSAATGTRLSVVDFTCAAPPCKAGSTGFAVSNARDLTPGVAEKTAWPSFAPSGDLVLYQRQYRSSKGLISWSPSDVNSAVGALAEIWASNVPANGSSPATPTRLASLNGVDGAGASYLPTRPRTVVDDATPLYHFPIVRHEMSQAGATGVPAVYLTGTAASSATAAGGPWDLRIKITAAGAVGTAKFQYSTDGGATYVPTTPSTTGTSVALGNATGLNAVFAAGTYDVASVYRVRVGNVSLAGTPQGGPWDFRVGIVTPGVRGTATFRYSTDGGVTWSATLPTAPVVSLGTTGLVASFDNVNFAANWVWGARVANYHDANAAFTMNIADNCRASATATNVNDYQLNYVPAAAPTEAGEMTWVVFTSRRMYGNVAYDDPWDAEPADTGGNRYACNSSTPPTKKLWIAALDKDFTPGSDPSHPAFYLPGQELNAGNSHAYWVSTPCAATGVACTSSDDCCGGSGATPTTRCNGGSKQCQPISVCAPDGGACATNADCCTGLICDGGRSCVDPIFYSTETFEREYLAECSAGYKVAWRFFEWQATLPTGTSIDLAVQTKREDDAPYEPEPSVALDPISTSSRADEWLHGTLTVDEALTSADVGSRAYLKVSMTFNPNADGNSSPLLTAWRQNYDCLPGE